MEVGMMFSKLARGAKFDTKRFLGDAQKLQLIRPQEFSKPVVKKSKSQIVVDGVVIKEEEADEDEDDDKLAKPSSPKTKNDAPNIKSLRKANNMHVWGSDLPDPIETFSSISGITDRILENIQASAYEVPTPVQMQAIPIILSGRELLASAPTGSGKTAAFLIPMFILLGRTTGKPKKSTTTTSSAFRALILAPTRELAKQIYRECVRLAEGTGLNPFILEGDKKKIRGDILISTPNRLVYMLKNEKISLSSISLLVVDECDHLFEAGFIDQLGAIYSACDSPEIKRAFFSATCAFGVEEFCKTHFDNHIMLIVGAKNAAGADLVEQSVTFCGNEAGKLVAFRDLIRKGIEPPVLVFVQSQDRANELLSELVFEGVKCNVIHSGKSEVQRERIVESFREGKIWILVCTALLSRGLDFPAVKLVINYDMPTTPVQYIHAIGRTGRAGRLGKAITFYTEDDKPNLRRTAQVLENSGFPVPPFLLRMKRLRKDEAERQARRPPKRGRISRMAKYDVEKRFKLKEMVKHSKKLRNKGNDEEAVIGKESVTPKKSKSKPNSSSASSSDKKKQKHERRKSSADIQFPKSTEKIRSKSSTPPKKKRKSDKM